MKIFEISGIAFTWVDILFLVILIISLFRGYKKGIILQLTGFAAILVAFMFYSYLSPSIYDFLTHSLKIGSNIIRIAASVLSFILIAVAVMIVGYVLKRFFHFIQLGLIDRLLGSLFSLLLTAIVLSLIMNVVTLFKNPERGAIVRQNSFSEKYLKDFAPSFSDTFNGIVGKSDKSGKEEK